MTLFLALILSICNVLNALKINPVPLCEVFTDKSWYQNELVERFAGDRKRFSSCSGVAWFDNDNRIATVNFQGGFISTYKFNESQKKCMHVQTIYGEKNVSLIGGENLTFNSDESLLAVSVNNGKNKHIHIFEVDPLTHMINPEVISTIKKDDSCFHGIRFSHSNNYMACTTVGYKGGIFVYAIGKKENILTCSLSNVFFPLKPKSIAFTNDDRYVAVVYSANILTKPHAKKGIIALFSYNKSEGVIDNKILSVYEDHDFKSGEDIYFDTQDTYLIVSDQVNDSIIVLTFDKESAQIGDCVIKLRKKDSNVSFPHGIGLSKNGKYLAATHYGDDKFSIYAINR